ncbi:MAG: phosphate starvation-inducible protein PhoH [Bdellovibrionales bacterium RIFCSPHIGHO2_01_FULL_40_29]|nr:MAG: phosphate starvation-inducible protein PhoH [Bdellovibrionales bacterium RIFCSPHIGHO2_01_FULL_40_29]OFZ35502.1 MAG: phosphate starvation-inducible protein PhoH [Bdellovibrionales bacterium RIFCSPHIGHO2_02_FULL_40_15]
MTTAPKTKRRKVVIDTNVILFDAFALLKFGDADIHIPFAVIEEVDKFKRDQGENGRNARQFSRFVDVLREKGSLANGVQIDNHETMVYITTDLGMSGLPAELDQAKADNRILSTALALQKQHPRTKVELITKDINLRIKADVYGIYATDYDTSTVDQESLYEGYLEISVAPDKIDQFYKTKKIEVDQKVYGNQYVILKDSSNPNHSAIGRYSLVEKAIIPLLNPPDSIWGIQARNVEQSFALDALLNDEIQMVSLVGKAGTGKTLLAIAAGLFKTLDEGRYQRLLVSRPIFPMGRDIGYLPGDIEQKLNPWMQPIFDNVEFLMGADKKAQGRAQELINQGMLNIEPLTYIRGRSIPKQYLIVDEAQNLTPHEIKTIVTRAGSGTKIVLTGDVYQIDNPYVDSANSGLTHAVEKFKGQSIAAHVTLTKGERSPLAELAANIL